MRKIRDVLTCLLERNLSYRDAALYTGVGRSAVHAVKKRFDLAGLTWPLTAEIDDIMLERALYPGQAPGPSGLAPPIDFGAVHESLKAKGATLATLHHEWLEQHPDLSPISYSHYCKLYQIFKKSLQISMRRIDAYGEVAYVDYSGLTMAVTNADTGEISQVQIFVGVLGASNYTYCEASATQRSRDWIASHVRMFEYFGGVPHVVVPDNLKAAVNKADRFSPVINETYLAMCRYYGTNPFPARAYKPRDKSKAESGVLLAQRWILFVLRRHKFFSIAELNREIASLLQKLNARKFQKLAGSRFSRWLEHERSALLPLPSQRYELSEWGKVRAGQDYHISIEEHFYSVPFQFKGRELETRLTEHTLDIICQGKVIATHTRSYLVGGTSTNPAHRPASHKAVANWTEEEAMSWAATVGPSAQAMLKQQLAKTRGHHFGYRITEAMRSLGKNYGRERLEAVCLYALAHKVSGTEDLRNIISKKLDLLLPDEIVGNSVNETDHENIRGAGHYERLLNSPGGNEA
ncbi:IS21 family transposase [Duganella sp. S19_KUP01_CR8]|uniref:IS21 family transposase n=1 Tax=Duganella sp. S19_KUP01_CR8 TaxID=3025502 RepID=UPI002FCDC18B